MCHLIEVHGGIRGKHRRVDADPLCGIFGMIGHVVVQAVLLGSGKELHGHRHRDFDFVQADFLVPGIHRRLLDNVVLGQVVLVHPGQQGLGIGGAGGPAVLPDEPAGLPDVGAAHKVGVPVHGGQLGQVVLHAGHHGVVSPERRADGYVLGAVPLLGLLGVRLAGPAAARFDAEQIVGVDSQFARSIGALNAGLGNAQAGQDAGRDTAVLALGDHDIDEVLLVVGLAVLQPRGDLLGDVRDFAQQVRAGAHSVRKHPVGSQAAVLVAGVLQLGHAVPLANVHAQLNQRGNCGIADVPVRVASVVCYLDCDGAVVIPPAITAPAAVALGAEQADTAPAVDGVVGAHRAAFFGYHSAEALQGRIACHVVDGDFGNRLRPRAVAVGADLGKRYEIAVAHCFFSFCQAIRCHL